jgi:hypothetical protein
VTANVVDSFKGTLTTNNTYTGVAIVNSSNGASAQARIVVGNDTSAVAVAMVASSTAAAPAAWLPVNTGAVRSVLAGGLSLAATDAAGDVRVYNRSGTLAATWGASQALTNVGTIAWGGGTALDSSTKVLMTDVSRTITAAQTFTGSVTITANYLAGSEMTAPSAPAANGFRLYAEDNGAGKTRLMCLFATGAAQQVASEP